MAICLRTLHISNMWSICSWKRSALFCSRSISWFKAIFLSSVTRSMPVFVRCGKSDAWSCAVRNSWLMRSLAAFTTLSTHDSMSNDAFGCCSMLTAIRSSWFSSNLARSHSSKIFSRCSCVVYAESVKSCVRSQTLSSAAFNFSRVSGKNIEIAAYANVREREENLFIMKISMSRVSEEKNERILFLLFTSPRQLYFARLESPRCCCCCCCCWWWLNSLPPEPLPPPPLLLLSSLGWLFVLRSLSLFVRMSCSLSRLSTFTSLSVVALTFNVYKLFFVHKRNIMCAFFFRQKYIYKCIYISVRASDEREKHAIMRWSLNFPLHHYWRYQFAFFSPPRHALSTAI